MLIRDRMAALVVLVSSALVAEAGPLNPPAGPIAPSNKTLNEVEPSIPIGPVTTPGTAFAVHVISEPGAYHLVDHVQGEAGKAGITINASNVTVDLRGFEVRGVAGSNWGITASGLRGIVVSNGTVQDWDQSGIEMSEADARVSGVWSQGNALWGIRVRSGSVIDCTARFNGNSGISLGDGTIERCFAGGNGGAGISCASGVVSDSYCVVNGGVGFAGSNSMFRDCVAVSDNVGFDSIRHATRCIARNVGVGFQINDGGIVHECVVQGTSDIPGGAGIDLGNGASAINCRVDDPSAGGITALRGCLIEGCEVRNSESIAIFTSDEAVVRNCQVFDGDLVGIYVGNRSRVSGCVAARFGEIGIFAFGDSTIEGCTVADVDEEGIFVDAGCTVSGSTVDNAGGSGIFGDSRILIRDCVVRRVGLVGIRVVTNSRVVGCIVNDAGTIGIEASSVVEIRDCNVMTTEGAGISAGDTSLVEGCTLNNIKGNGITVFRYSTVRGNRLDFIGPGMASGSGIVGTGAGNAFLGNSISRADTGIVSVGSTGIIDNLIHACPVNISGGAGDVVQGTILH